MRKAAIVVVLLGLGLASRAHAGICDGVAASSESPLTSVRIAFGTCSNDAARACRYPSDCVSPGTCSSGLTKPLYVTAPPGDTGRIFILEQDGRIRIVRNGVLLPVSFLDVDAITQSTGNEEGLLGLAFSPDYATDGYFFIYHTDNGGNSNTIARYHVSANPDLADAASRTVLFSIPHPTNSNHNGGCIQFSPDDGYLYIGTGDGGSSCDPPGNAQNTNEWKGKLLRIDVIPVPVPPAAPYRIPADNPGYPKPEIFSIGMRNPWRYSFDRGNPNGPATGRGDLYIADVGQSSWEEVDYRPVPAGGRGENFGWDQYEGTACPPPACGGACVPINPRVDPVKTYAHSGGACSITGGYVYRGCRMPGLAAQSRYFYADYCTAAINSFVMSGGAVTSEKTYTTELAPVGGLAINSVTSFGEDARGELYIVDRGGAAGTGEVFKIVPVLANLEVSGQGAAPAFRLGANWTWEDLSSSSDHPLDFYRVYRHTGNGNGLFTCVYRTPAVSPPNRPVPAWPGGDPQSPAAGGLFSYVVTAVRSLPFEESSPGRSSSGAPRTLSPASCP